MHTRKRRVSAFGRRLREIRATHGWSLATLAKMSGVDESTLSKLEKGDRRSPLAETVVAVSRGTRLSTDYLLGLGIVARGRRRRS